MNITPTEVNSREDIDTSEGGEIVAVEFNEFDVNVNGEILPALVGLGAEMAVLIRPTLNEETGEFGFHVSLSRLRVSEVEALLTPIIDGAREAAKFVAQREADESYATGEAENDMNMASESKPVEGDA